ncbi:uncharacterized protein LOC121382923 [Gigantopelta aegis]|uniref:uncharacterized protein LOC121382923 n=1 Tax=Gigantopelta aegis TaxID=1735272 RepID=UPI001B88DD23|nr:uncharacterized protein LOC121382923 [Gigantopelta aegis]
MVSVFQSLRNNLTTGDIVLSRLRTLCPRYRNYRQCIELTIDLCDSNIVRTHRFLTDTFQYVCDEAGRDIDTYNACWGRYETIDALRTCGSDAIVHLSVRGQRCRFFEDFESCTFYRIGQLCGEEPAVLMANFLNRSNTQNKVDFQCIRPPPYTGDTITQKLQIRCYDCHNAIGSASVHCPLSGNISDWWAAKTQCSGRCFARSPGWVREVVYRGCTTGFWLPNPLPRSGCWALNGNSRDIWCLCETDLCNTMDMRDIVEDTRI